MPRRSGCSARSLPRPLPVFALRSRGIILGLMIHDLITAFIVAFAAVTASDQLS
jgi:hypothetical protein